MRAGRSGRVAAGAPRRAAAGAPEAEAARRLSAEVEAARLAEQSAAEEAVERVATPAREPGALVAAAAAIPAEGVAEAGGTVVVRLVPRGRRMDRPPVPPRQRPYCVPRNWDIPIVRGVRRDRTAGRSS